MLHVAAERVRRHATCRCCRMQSMAPETCMAVPTGDLASSTLDVKLPKRVRPCAAAAACSPHPAHHPLWGSRVEWDHNKLGEKLLRAAELVHMQCSMPSCGPLVATFSSRVLWGVLLTECATALAAEYRTLCIAAPFLFAEVQHGRWQACVWCCSLACWDGCRAVHCAACMVLV